MKRLGALLLLFLLPCASHAQQAAPNGRAPINGIVPDSATAVRIAVAVWIPLYGEASIMKEQPFVAVLQDSVWTVRGTLASCGPNCVVTGGTVEAKIAKRDGRILFVTHYQ